MLRKAIFRGAMVSDDRTGSKKKRLEKEELIDVEARYLALGSKRTQKNIGPAKDINVLKKNVQLTRVFPVVKTK